MTELSKLLRAYLLSTIITLILTLGCCGILLAQNMTEKMIFG